MKRAVPLAEAGYTIVETMIFLIISGALMVSAALLFNGKISRSQFTVAVRQFGSSIDNNINDVSTGTYSAASNFTCTSGGVSSPSLVPSANPDTQGTNTGCIFVGKVLHPGGAGCSDDVSKCTDLATYTVMANRLFNNTDSTSLFNAKPINADSSDPDSIDLTSHQTLPNGLYVTAIYGINGASPAASTPYGAVGFFQTFPQSQSGVLQSGSQHVQVVPLGNSYPASQTDIDTAVGLAGSKPVDVSGGVVICVAGGGRASITIGLANSNLTTNIKIGDSVCPNL